MRITIKEIKKVAHLARLEVNASQAALYEGVLSDFLALIKPLTAINTDDCPPMSHPFGDLSQPLREDKITETNQIDLFQALAPLTEAGLYLVPTVIASE